jgi:hypothetical protein
MTRHRQLLPKAVSRLLAEDERVSAHLTPSQIDVCWIQRAIPGSVRSLPNAVVRARQVAGIEARQAKPERSSRDGLGTW